MRIKSGLFVALVLALALCAPGCKKKGGEAAKKGSEEKAKPEKKEKAAAKETPAEAVAQETEETPVEAATPAEAVAGQSADVVEAGAQADEQPAVAAPEEAEKPAEVAAEEPVEAAVEESAEGDDGTAEEPAAEEPAPVGDVVTQPSDVAEADVPEGHYGRPFKLEAMMMLHDVVKHADHYATFETIKLRGEVLSIVGDLMLMGFRNKDGLWVFLTKFDEGVPSQMEMGKTVVVEGKIASEDWDMDALGSIKMQEGESLEASYKHVLTVEAGSEVGN